MTAPDIAEIAKGLSDKQHAGIWRASCSRGVAASLRRKGLILHHETAYGVVDFTPLGLAVRAHLQEAHDRHPRRAARRQHCPNR